MNPDFLSLSHETTICNFKKILMTKHIKTSYFSTKSVEDQFPGVYLSLLMTSTPYKILFSQIALIIPMNLLYEQKNWHYNVIDKNGIITYDTYFHNNLQEIPEGNKVIEHCKPRCPGSEVVFHDALPISLIKYVVCKNKDVYEELKKYIKQTVKDIRQFNPNFSYDLKIVLSDNFDFKQKVVASNTDDMNKDILPIPFYLSDELYTGGEYKFYNKPTLSKMTGQYYKNMILNRLSVPDRNRLLIYLDKTQSKVHMKNLINKLTQEERLSEEEKKELILYIKRVDDKNVKKVIDRWIIDSQIIDKYINNPELR